MAAARAGNTLNDAPLLDAFNRSVRVDGSVSARDPFDFYKVEIPRISSSSTNSNTIAITLRRLQNNADLALLDEQGRVLATSGASGKVSEVVSDTAIDAGTYYIRVSRVSGSTRYRLTVVTSSVAGTSTQLIDPLSDETFTAKDLRTARRVNIVGTTQTFRGSTGSKLGDLYRFTLDQDSTFSLVLRKLSANADVYLLNRQGQVIAQSQNPGKQAEVIVADSSLASGQLGNAQTTDLAAGTYYVRVFSRGRPANYTLLMTAIVNTNTGSPNSGGGGQTPTLVDDINPGPVSSDPSDLAILTPNTTSGATGSILFFAATDATNGREIWRSDGTAAGTQRVTDINPGAAGSIPTDTDPTRSALVAFNGFIYFAATDSGATGTELWRTDGTLVQQVADIDPGPASSNPSALTVFNGALYFAADSGNGQGRELYRTDGTTIAPVRGDNINPGPADSNPTELTVVGNSLYFTATNTIFGTELWRTDGTSVNLVSDLNPGPTGSNPTGLVNFNNTLYFAADDGAGDGRELWRTAGGIPTLVQDIFPGGSSSNPTDLTVSGNLLFFAATNTFGTELWATDGTQTRLVNDINPGGASSNPADLVDVNGRLYFTADTGTIGRQIFLSNGTFAGTTEVTFGLNTLNPNNLLPFGNNLFFAAFFTATGSELYSIPVQGTNG